MTNDSLTPPSLAELSTRALCYAALASVLNGRRPSSAPFLRPECFPEIPDQACYRAMLEMERDGLPIETGPLAMRLAQISPQLIDPGIQEWKKDEWLMYLVRVDTEPQAFSPLGFERYAQDLYDNWRRWKLAWEAHDALIDSLDMQRPLPPDDALLAVTRKPRTVEEILDAVVPEPRGPWKGVIPPGLTLLGARPKSGKSVLMLQLGTALGCGGMHFGQKVEPMPVLYYALEDKTARLQARMQQMGTGRESTMKFLMDLAPLHGDGLHEIVAMCAHYGLIIIDTVERAMPRMDFTKDGKVYADVLGKIQQAALEHNMSVVAVVHRRKQMGMSNADPVDDVMGSTQLTTTADCVLCIYYPDAKDGKRTKRAQLLGRARDQEDVDLAMEFDRATLSWQPVDEAAEEAEEQVREQTQAEREILEALKELGKANASMVANAIGANRGSTWSRLQTLWKDGEVCREMLGTVPYYYIKTEQPAPIPTQEAEHA